MYGILGLKLVLVPSLVGGITLAGRRWGPGVAGWLAAFPVISAPILFFVALEQGKAFAATAATATLIAVLAILAFGVGYSWTATRYSWAPSVVAGFTAYFATIAALNLWTPSLLVATGVVGGALLVAPRLYPLPGNTPIGTQGALSRDMLYRMLFSATLVFLVTHFSSRLGPHLSGLFALFPAIGSVLAVFSHRDIGAPFTIRMLRSMVFGYYAFASFCLTLALALPVTDIVPAFALALGCAIAVQLVSRLYLHAATRDAPLAE